jgi:hypothetical protein
VLDFSRSFDRAWERMVAILFRPFDLGKWFVIGFSAFLAGLLSGGNGGLNFNNVPSQNSFSPGQQQLQLHQQFSHFISTFGALQIGTIVLIGCLFFVLVIALSALFAWLGARGQFLFLDNIVRNRAAIAEPWRYYAGPANQVFIFQLICLALGFAVALLFVLPAGFLVVSLFFRHATALPLVPAFPATLGLIALGLAYFVTVIAFAVFLFLFREWGVALMFRHPITVREALGQTWALIRAHPGSVTVFILLRIALWIGLIVVSLLSCCVFCCFSFLPYTSSVILLPALIFMRCFSLECLAQFGPAYDVFTVDLPPESFAPAVSPLPPPG